MKDIIIFLAIFFDILAATLKDQKAAKWMNALAIYMVIALCAVR